MQALLTTPLTALDLNWYPDFGTTHHLTADVANLNVKANEYHGPNQIRIGNSLGLTVKHIGSTHLSTPTSSFLLNDVLHVPHVTKNLIFVRKFTTDTNTLIEFHPTHFFVKDRTTGKVLLHRLSKDGLYLFTPIFNKIPSSSFAFVGECTSPNQWHSRLGHPAFKVVHHVPSRFSLPFSSNKTVRSCSACFSSKSKQIPFALSCTQVNSPLKLIFTDVWGSPICSKFGSKYYVSFMDAYSRYTWLYPMTNKSDILSIFIKWQKYVERYLNTTIKMVQSDWGGEYRSLHNFLQNCDITHRVSCPHTHQQNGVVEHKHRHVVETYLALLYHAKVPLQYWDEAFQTACYLINRLPTSALKNQSPFEKLFHQAHDYNFLRVFGFSCWPNLRPYNSYKLQPRSIPCVFLSYSLLHKGYKCFISLRILFIYLVMLFLMKHTSLLQSVLLPLN